MSEGIKLEDENAYLRQIVAASHDGIFVVDRDLRYLEWNQAMEQMTGIRADVAIGQLALEIFPYLVGTREDIALRRALAGEIVDSKDRPFSIVGSGKHGYYNAQYRPLEGHDGRVLGVLGVVHNITGQKRTEARVRETEQRFHHMANVSPVLLWMSREDGLCTFFNQSWLDFTGRTIDEEWGVGWADGVYFEDFQRCVDTYNTNFNARTVFQMEYRLRRKDGEYRWVLDSGAPRYEPDGRFAGYIGSCTDITAIKHIESELRTGMKARDEFLSIASHELRTPLASLQLQLDSMSRLLTKHPEVTAKVARIGQSADLARDAVRRLARLIQVLLDVCRLSEGRLNVAPMPGVDFMDVVRSSIDGVRSVVDETGSEIRVESSGDLKGDWDVFRIEQVLINLLTNALKYGSGQPIDVQVHGNGDSVELVVADRGIGIPVEDQQRIFERFERAVSAKHFGGFGLGLWITREIVRTHGGTIRVESAPNQGSRFYVALPRRSELLAAPAQEVRA